MIRWLWQWRWSSHRPHQLKRHALLISARSQNLMVAHLVKLMRVLTPPLEWALQMMPVLVMLVLMTPWECALKMMRVLMMLVLMTRLCDWSCRRAT